MVALFDTQKAVEKLRRSGVPEGEAAATVEVMTEAASELVTTDRLDAAVERLRAEILRVEERQRTELYRALLIAAFVIIGTMTAIMTALTQL